MAEPVAAVRLSEPYGGCLVDLRVDASEREELLARAHGLTALRLSARSVNDLELLAVGGFSPLDRFLGEADYRAVLATGRLADGTLFPIPVTLPLPDGDRVEPGETIALRSPRNTVLAVLEVQEVYGWEPLEEASAILGTTDPAHPLVSEQQFWGRRYVSGPLRVLQLPVHHDFPALRLTPADARAALAHCGRENVVAFQTRNPIHRAHEELIRRALEAVDGALLLHPVVGLTKPGDVDHYTRVRSYRALLERYLPRDRTVLALLPLAMRLAGPREAVWHAIVRRNYGANYLILGRDHASPGVGTAGRPYWGPYEAQELVARHAAELGVKPLLCHNLVYLPDEDRYAAEDELAPDIPRLSLSGTQVREDYLARGRKLPDWFTRPEVADMLAHAYPARTEQGVCIWFTGLSSTGKSTTADVLVEMLMAAGRQVTLLDGDVVRTHLSKGLGFSREDRDTNILRIGYVAAEIVRHHGTVVCAAISPYEATRQRVQAMVGKDQFVLVYLDTPLEVCERRDAKGLYALARAGKLREFTGVDDPYEPPLNPQLCLQTVSSTPAENARRVLEHLVAQGLLPAEPA